MKRILLWDMMSMTDLVCPTDYRMIVFLILSRRVTLSISANTSFQRQGADFHPPSLVSKSQRRTKGWRVQANELDIR